MDTFDARLEDPFTFGLSTDGLSRQALPRAIQPIERRGGLKP
jgi:hypothetical protein